MHGHSQRTALVVGAGGIILGLAIVVLIPNHRIASTVGAGFVILIALKHLGLLLVVASPAAALAAQVRGWLRRRGRRAAVPPSRSPDGYYRTGEAEPHKGVLVEHDVKVLPADRSRSSLIELDVDKRLTIRALREINADEMREGLRDRYAKRGFVDDERVATFLAGLTGRIAPDQCVAISYDSGSKVTRLSVSGAAVSAAEGIDFMKATWSLWFGESVPSALGDSLMSNLP
jgi:hypothetical protein